MQLQCRAAMHSSTHQQLCHLQSIQSWIQPRHQSPAQLPAAGGPVGLPDRPQRLRLRRSSLAVMHDCPHCARLWLQSARHRLLPLTWQQTPLALIPATLHHCLLPATSTCKTSCIRNRTAVLRFGRCAGNYHIHVFPSTCVPTDEQLLYCSPHRRWTLQHAQAPLRRQSGCSRRLGLGRPRVCRQDRAVACCRVRRSIG